MTQTIETVAILPAYNERQTVGDVVSACMIADLVDAVVFVDDGSSDDTSGVAYAAGALQGKSKLFEILHNPNNTGKAEAMIKGFRLAREIGGASLETLLFLDTDISPISSRDTEGNRKLFSRRPASTTHAQAIDPFKDTLAARIDELVMPVKAGDSVMEIALLNRNPTVDWLRLKLGWGALSGCRAVNASLFAKMLGECQELGIDIHGWEIEAAMNTYTRKRCDSDDRKLNKSIGKQLWPDVVNVGSRVKAGSLSAGIRRMLEVQGSALRGFIKYDAVFD